MNRLQTRQSVNREQVPLEVCIALYNYSPQNMVHLTFCKAFRKGKLSSLVDYYVQWLSLAPGRKGGTRTNPRRSVQKGNLVGQIVLEPDSNKYRINLVGNLRGVSSSGNMKISTLILVSTGNWFHSTCHLHIILTQ